MVVESNPSINIVGSGVGLYIMHGSEYNKLHLYEAMKVCTEGEDSVLLFTCNESNPFGVGKACKLSVCDRFELYSDLGMQNKLREISKNSLILLDLVNLDRVYVGVDGEAFVEIVDKGVSIVLNRSK